MSDHTLSPLAGQIAPKELLVDIDAIEKNYFLKGTVEEYLANPVSFGTSGHRGSSLARTFTEGHVLAIAQAICDYRKAQGITGPLFLGKDTHALSAPAEQTVLEVLSANDVHTIIQEQGGCTPTPVISHAILSYNRNRPAGSADGILLTPSHNPPEDGGLKYNPPHGGPADTEVTRWIQTRANELLAGENRDVRRMALVSLDARNKIQALDLVQPYVDELPLIVDMAAIAAADISLAVDPLGGASLSYWQRIAERYSLGLEVVNTSVDPQFAFMSVDHDGKIRMDCSSPHAMASILKLKDRFRLAFANDPDADRHGIVAPHHGLLNPNHYLAVAIDYLIQHRPQWSPRASIGKTLVSSSMIDRVVKRLGRTLYEVPVGFKWFSPGLYDGSCCFGGEESAGASFLRHDGGVWSTDKDGIILNLLAAEILAITGEDPGQRYDALARELGNPSYTRIDAPADATQRQKLQSITAESIVQETLAGERITSILTKAPGNNAGIGGVKVSTEQGWFAARPSGTEDIYKIYAESFLGEQHLQSILTDAQSMLSNFMQS